MNSLSALTGFALMLTACAMPFDLLGEPSFIRDTDKTVIATYTPHNDHPLMEFNNKEMEVTPTLEDNMIVYPNLIVLCQPLAAPVNGRVYCEYNLSNLTCSAACDNGFEADVNTMFSTKTCTYEMPYGADEAFGACRMAVPTMAPTLAPVVTDSPVVGPVVVAGRCIHNVMECGTDEGDFQACMDCRKYVTCSVNGATLRDCPAMLQWDDSVKRCETRSTTCM